MVIRDPSRGPTSRSRRCDRALGHRSHNRPRPDHIESPDSPHIVAASIIYVCRTCQRRRAQSDPPKTPHCAARRCDRTAGPITRLWGSLWAHLSLREGGENRPRTPSSTTRRLVASSVSPNTRESYTSALRQFDTWRGRRPLDDATLAGAAGRFRARLSDHPDPASKGTDRVLAGFRRTADHLSAVLATCHRPRKSGRGIKAPTTAARRGRLDAAIAGLLFMAGLRRSEVAALRWSDVTDADVPNSGVLVTDSGTAIETVSPTQGLWRARNGPRMPLGGVLAGLIGRQGFMSAVLSDLSCSGRPG